MSKKKKLTQDELDAQEASNIKRVEYDVESDSFSKDERAKIVKMVMADYEIGIDSMREWKEKKKKDLQHINNEAPSKIENLNKRSWMSDRNLGLASGILDIFQATLLATCYNPNSLHFIATERNDVDNKDNLARFTKWMLGDQEVNAFPEIDDFISNRSGLGFSVLKIGWEVEHRWVDKHVPKRSKYNKLRTIGFGTKTEYKRFERGTLKNIDELDDIILPSYGKNIQKLPFFIERLHQYWADLESDEDAGVIIKGTLTDKVKDAFRTIIADERNSLRKADATAIGIDDISDEDLRSYPVDIYEWYGDYKKGNKKERYRFWVEPTTETLLAGKPLRKIRRDGKYPYAGGPLRRRPGFLRGGSLTTLIAPVINAINNTYNQKSDFQYFQNVPWGIRRTNEGFSTPVMDMEPGKMFDYDGDPNADFNFPNMSRSLAWADNDINFLLQVLERLTGAASYFLSTESKGSTATRDSIVEQKSDTKFSLWVKRIIIDIAEAINMLVINYQDWAEPKLGERVLGEDGKELIRNLSINSLCGGYAPKMVPDIIQGSKVFEQRMKMFGLQLASNSIWFQPQINPRGSWMLTEEAMKVNGYQNAESYMPPQPKMMEGTSDEVKNEWHRFMQGDRFDPPEGESALVMEHWAGHKKQEEEKYMELDEEYRANFDNHVYQTFVNMMKFIKKQQHEMLANQVAMRASEGIEQYNNPNAPTGNQPTNAPAPAPNSQEIPGQQPVSGNAGQPPPTGAPQDMGGV